MCHKSGQLLFNIRHGSNAEKKTHTAFFYSRPTAPILNEIRKAKQQIINQISALLWWFYALFVFPFVSYSHFFSGRACINNRKFCFFFCAQFRINMFKHSYAQCKLHTAQSLTHTHTEFHLDNVKSACNSNFPCFMTINIYLNFILLMKGTQIVVLLFRYDFR